MANPISNQWVRLATVLPVLLMAVPGGESCRLPNAAPIPKMSLS